MVKCILYLNEKKSRKASMKKTKSIHKKVRNCYTLQTNTRGKGGKKSMTTVSTHTVDRWKNHTLFTNPDYRRNISPSLHG